MLPHHPGQCSRLHGHSYRLEVAVAGPLQDAGPSQGMVLDFDELASVVESAVIERLDHSSLNDLLPNPTAEHIAQWVWQQLAPRLAGLDEIAIWETATACAVVRADDARAR